MIRGGPRPTAALREDAITMGLAAVTLVGLYWDGMLHNSSVAKDSFWSAPHIAIYSGLTLLACWIGIVLLRRQRSLPSLDLSAIPYGYGVALVALPLAAAGGPADYLWHEAYGFENQIDAPYSPTHQMLFLAGAMLGAIGVASAWRRPGRAPSLPVLLPAIVSVTVVVGVALFVFQHLVPFFMGAPATEDFQRDLVSRPDAYEPGSGATHSEGLYSAVTHYGDDPFPYYFFSTLHTVAGVMIVTALLVGAALFMLRRWRLPFGTLTIVFTSLALVIPLLSEYEEAELIPALAVAGLIADLLLRRLASMRLFAPLLAVVLWGAYLLAVELLEGGLGWEPTLWLGVLATAAGVAYGLALLVFPAPVEEPEPSGSRPL